MSVATDGFELVEGLLCSKQVEHLIAALEQFASADQLRHGGGIFAIRNLLEIPAIQELATSPSVRRLVEPVLGRECFAVRGILFDKVPGANWKVPWHQDVTVEVEERRDVDGFGPWSVKAGVVHVQPPRTILEGMLSVRIHLDPCLKANGALRVLPGSHTLGRISESGIPFLKQTIAEVTCEVHTGGAMLMRPLLLHASSASESPAHRRVVHLDFANGPLPPELKWRALRGAVN